MSLDLICLAAFAFALKNNKLSYANNKWLILGAFSATTIPPSCVLLLFKRHDKSSAQRRKRYGEIGSPCLIRLDGLNSSNLSPLKSTEKDTVVTHFIIKSIHLFLKPNLAIVEAKYGHSTRSYALDISSLRAQYPLCFFTIYSHKVQTFIGCNYVIRDDSMWDKGRLLNGNDFRNNSLEPISYCF